MPGGLLSDAIEIELGAQEPWPLPIKLYQPYEVEQILLPDNANCLAVQAYLKMCGLEFHIEPRSNAEYMSPSGRVPFIQCGLSVIPEFDPIVNFVNNKGTSLSEHLDQSDKADMRAYISLINNVLVNAEQYICWVDQATFNSVTKIRYGSVYPWPLNHYLNWRKQNQIKKKLSVLGWYNKPLDEIYNDVKLCCEALVTRLQDRPFFFGEKPTELDALVYGHVHALTTTEMLPSTQKIIATVRQFPELIRHAYFINNFYMYHNSNCIDEDLKTKKSVSEDSLWNFSGSLESLPPLTEDFFII